MTAPPQLGPCEPRATETDLCDPCADYAIDSSLMDDMLAIANYILYMAEGQQFPGQCSETIRPCSQRTAYEFYGSSTSTYAAARASLADWPNAVCGCSSPQRCSCSTLPSIELPHYPIASIDEVLIDGTTLSPSAYRIDAYRYLVRTDGDSWPCCQDLSLPSTAPDTFAVTYTYGHEVPSAGVHAVAILACELYQSCNPDGFETECRLPRNIASLARQGVSMAFQLVDELFSPRNNRPMSFGIPEIDMWLGVVNPNGLTSPTVILSPDDPDLARLTDT